MKSSSIKLSVILVMLYPLAIEMKSKRCHKQPNPGQVSPWIGLESKDGTSYEWASGNTTESNLYDNWSNTNTIIYGVGRCVFMNVSNKEWLSKAQSTCNSVKDEFICEFLDLINNHDKT
ncbi:uncharacterized protein LOC127721413 isoform X3 [Mytilus californianus]|uniref:uncharacterized protein LOC127721413 isoform X3 n=1 Tax=Mytilus californianus TaxID=6549 RepID=UPI002245AB55|nr:uncharacterized protein LOC127721413 isoform X3 [Mytilus californianus]